MHGTNAPLLGQRMPRSLRLRLILWYGMLLAVALSFFAIFFLALTTDAITQSVDSAVRAEAQIARLDLRHYLLPTPPYWSAHLSLNTIDTDRDFWIAVVNLDARGQVQYPAVNSQAFRIPITVATMRSVYAGQTVWYTTTIAGEHARVEALPIRAPLSASNSTPSNTGPVISTLLIAKSLSDSDATLLQLRALLLLSGLATLVGTLICSWLIATHVLRPLAEMVVTARAIVTSTARGTRLGKLNHRVRPTGGHDEMAQVVETFNEMLASLESAMQTQRRFVADASHELRAPLTTVQGNLAFLRQHIDELPLAERDIMLADAHDETLRLAKLVEDLLLLARADANVDTPLTVHPLEAMQEEHPYHSPIELDRAALQLVRQLRRRLNAEGSQLRLEISHIEPVRVCGDEERLRQAMLILLDNALKYTLSNDQKNEGRVAVAVERVSGRAVLRVSDTGIGIEPDDLPHIFERFYRTDRARSRHGTGLGLSIAQTLVEQLGGYITAESTPGKGSVFSIWLPQYG